MLGDLPPSSRVRRFTLAAASRMISRPTAVEPVKEILSTPGWVTSAAPISLPRPVSTLRTPGGKPASCASSASRSADSGVCVAGFSITVLPQARAGAIFHAAWISGKFQGTIAATTPIGSRSV